MQQENTNYYSHYQMIITNHGNRYFFDYFSEDIKTYGTKTIISKSFIQEQLHLRTD